MATLTTRENSMEGTRHGRIKTRKNIIPEKTSLVETLLLEKIRNVEPTCRRKYDEKGMLNWLKNQFSS